jgi:hypothetical protein
VYTAAFPGRVFSGIGAQTYESCDERPGMSQANAPVHKNCPVQQADSKRCAAVGFDLHCRKDNKPKAGEKAKDNKSPMME